MSPFLPQITEVDSIHFFFATLNMSWMTIAFIIIVALTIMKTFEYIDKKIEKIGIFKRFICLIFLLIFSGITFLAILTIYFDTTHKNINATPIKTVFSSYRIVKIKQPKESDSNITYDASGNKEPERPKTLFKVYLDKIKDVKNIELEHNVVLDVSKVNEDSFEIILPDEKVEKIKKDDAPEVFNALKKIKDDDNWMKINKMLKDRQVEKEE